MNMDLRMSTVSAYLPVLVLLTLFADNLAANFANKLHVKYGHHKLRSAVTSSKISSSNIHDKSCKCRVILNDGTVIKDFGRVANYTSSDSSHCHKLHHACRKTCTGKLDLHKHLPGTTTTLGYHYCDKRGQSTPSSGVQVHAAWETTSCHQYKEQKSLKTAKLCCGHTHVPVASFTKASRNVLAKVLGWNPDCTAQTFVIGG